MKKTYVPKGQVEREWLLIDADGQNLGRLSTQIAQLLLGKHKPNYTPGVMTGANVVVVNAEKVAVYPTRMEEKIYYRHSNYPSGLKEITLKDQLQISMAWRRVNMTLALFNLTYCVTVATPTIRIQILFNLKLHSKQRL